MMKFKLLSVLTPIVLFLLNASMVKALSSDEVFAATNAIRLSNSLPSLTINGRLQSAAALKLADIQRYRYWAHNNPQTGTIWTMFIRKTGYSGHAGENLASNYSTADAVISGWLHSPSHKANLLGNSYKEVGIAVGDVDFGNGNEIVVVAEFGSGISKTIARR